MKLAIVLSSLIFSASAFAASSTTINVSSEATKSEVRSALNDLVAALKSVDGSPAYKKFIKSASEKLKSKSVSKKYDAALMCNGENAIAEAISAGESVGSNGECEVSSICYAGKIETSLSLLQAAMAQDLFNWDESWLEKARIKGQTIEVDYVDGPNEIRETYTFKACR